MNAATTAPRTMVPGGTIDLNGLSYRARHQIASVIRGDACERRPVMIGVVAAAQELGEALSHKPTGLAQSWRIGIYPCPDIWSGVRSGGRRMFRIPTTWIEDGIRLGRRGVARRVSKAAFQRALEGWPREMSTVQVARAISAGDDTVRRLISGQALPATRLPNGRLLVAREALAGYLAACVDQAIEDWKRDRLLDRAEEAA